MDVTRDFEFLYAWLTDLAERYRNRIRIEVVNVSSFRGFLKSLRHWAHTYPTFIVDGEETYSGRDRSRLDGILDRHLDRPGQHAS